MRLYTLPLVVIAVILYFLLLIYIPLSFDFYRRRTTYPIKGRSPLIILSINICMYIWGTSTTVLTIYGNHAPCLIGCWGVSPFLFFCLHLFEYRGISLLFDYEITADIVTRKNNKNNKINWFTLNKHLIQPEFCRKFAIFVILWYFGGSLIATVLSLSSSSPTCQSWVIGLFYNFVFPISCFFNLLLITFLGFKLRNQYHDAFMLKTEFSLVVWIGFVTVIIYAIIGIFIVPINQDLIGLQGITTLIALHLFFLIGTVWPLRCSYQKVIEKSQYSQTLSSFLNSPESFHAFFQYLQLEFSSETLAFYMEVMEYQTLSLENPDLIRTRAASILSTYIESGSHFQVTIAYTTLQQIREDYDRLLDRTILQDSDLHLFDVAKDEIYYLMANDAWPRFQQTNEYQHFLNSIELYSPPTSTGPTIILPSMTNSRENSKGTLISTQVDEMDCEQKDYEGEEKGT